MRVHKYHLFLVSMLWVIFIVVLLDRASQGFNFISDEIFYLTADVAYETKRIFFIKMAQLFSEQELNVTFLIASNAVFIIFISKLLFDINYRNATITFLQCIYIPVIAAFLLRDVYIYFFIVYIIYSVEKIGFINKKYKVINAVRLAHSAGLITSLVLLLDFRPQMLLIVFLSLFTAYLTKNLKLKSTITLALIVVFTCLVLLPLILEYIQIYGISMKDYLLSREERFDMEFSIFSILKSFATHFLAPIPTSLIDRLLILDSARVYPITDDLFRLVYRSGLYCVITYIFLNVKYISRSIDYNKERFTIIFIISISNSIIYSVFSFGGGHERVKIISMFFIFYLASAISKVKRTINEENCFRPQS